MAELGYRHYAGLKGSKEKWVGTDASIYQYTSPETAISAAQPGDVINITSGSYTISATMTLNKPLTINGIGDVTLTGAVANRLVMVNVPAAGSTATLITVNNIKFVNTAVGADCLEIDNDAGSTGSLTTVWNQCGFTAEGTGLAVDMDANDTVVCQHYFYGARHLPLTPDCNIDLEIDASVAHFSGYQLDAGETFICGTTDKAWLLELDNIVYSSAALTTGGSASHILNASNCSKIASNAHTVVAVGDFDATSASENIGLNTQAS
jgi:hypothetical protein